MDYTCCKILVCLKHLFHLTTSYLLITSLLPHLLQNLSFLWHSRLGHPFDVKFQSLGHVLPSLLNCCNKDCIVCSLAKQKRLLFPFDNKMSEFSFDLIHMDEWGPFSVPTSEGFT